MSKKQLLEYTHQWVQSNLEEKVFGKPDKYMLRKAIIERLIGMANMLADFGVTEYAITDVVINDSCTEANISIEYRDPRKIPKDIVVRL